MPLRALNIDRYGLDEVDNKNLTTTLINSNGGPNGLTTISTALGEDAGNFRGIIRTVS